MPRRKVPDKWPFPGDSTLDRARRVAESYRLALLRADPDECAHLDAQAINRGQGWIVPQRGGWESNDLLTADELADYCYVKPRTVDAWVSRGLKVTETVDGRRFRYEDVLEFQATLRIRRAETHREPGEGTTVVPSVRLNTGVPTSTIPPVGG